MNPLSIIESWIISELINDTTLTAIVPAANIYYGAADTDAPSLFLTVSYVDAEPFYNLGTKREHAWAEYDITVWQEGKDTRSMKQAANRVDELFSEFRAETFTQNSQTWQFYSKLTRPLGRKDISHPPKIWRGMGGTYRVSASKV
jgi:hypothetical protein